MSARSRREWRVSTTALAGGATLTLDSTDLSSGVLSGRLLTGYVIADQASAASGFTIDQSGDGTNWDVNSLTIALVANTSQPFSIKLTAKHVRIKLVNGVTLQGSLRLFSYLDEDFGGAV